MNAKSVPSVIVPPKYRWPPYASTTASATDESRSTIGK